MNKLKRKSQRSVVLKINFTSKASKMRWYLSVSTQLSMNQYSDNVSFFLPSFHLFFFHLCCHFFIGWNAFMNNNNWTLDIKVSQSIFPSGALSIRSLQSFFFRWFTLFLNIDKLYILKMWSVIHSVDDDDEE